MIVWVRDVLNIEYDIVVKCKVLQMYFGVIDEHAKFLSSSAERLRVRFWCSLCLFVDLQCLVTNGWPQQWPLRLRG